jgi:hypothetical protein
MAGTYPYSFEFCGYMSIIHESQLLSSRLHRPCIVMSMLQVARCGGIK